MPKRPRFSRWRRLPPVFRSGEYRPIGSGNELDRIILYLPARLLDLAEALAEKAGIPAIQEYCARLLGTALEAERDRQKVIEFETRRGPLEGLKEIAADPTYLAEWQAEAESKPQLPPPAVDALTVDFFLAGDDEASDHDETASAPLSHAGLIPPATAPVLPAGTEGEVRWVEEGRDPGPVGRVQTSPPLEERRTDTEPVAATAPPPVQATGRAAVDGVALELLFRHVGHGPDGDVLGFLPCLRRGVAVPVPRREELLRVLRQLEADHRGATLLDRRMAHALHRLALESQVLLTDAWPGVFDEPMIATIRAVQEAVERILSGQDIRYYPAPASP